MTFQVIEYDPGNKIGFLIFINGVGSVRFTLSLSVVDTGNSKMVCDYLLTGHSKFGNKELKRYREKKIEKEVKSLEQDLKYWLENRSLRPAEE